MTSSFIMDSEIKLILKPENNIEKEMLTELFKQSVSCRMFDKMQIADVGYTDSILIAREQPHVIQK